MGARLARPVSSNYTLWHHSIESKSNHGLPHHSTVFTFDALGTLYTFKEPVGQQYLKVAQRCGYKGFVRPRVIEDAFKVSYKDLVKQYPNYGKGRLADAREWWALLVRKTFHKAIPGAHLPRDLPDQLYLHFSSGAAYRLYEDVKPMFQRLRKERKVALHSIKANSKQWSQIPVVGVITNSDPRAIQVLRDLGLRVGTVEPQRVLDGSAVPGWFGTSRVIASDWNPNNDVDFVCTSWDAGSEKPDQAIFDHAMVLAEAVIEAMTKQYLDGPVTLLEGRSDIAEEIEIHESFRQARSLVSWCHIGDDIDKDYAGASSWGSLAVFLKRDRQPTDKEAWSLGPGKHVKHIQSLGQFRMMK